MLVFFSSTNISYLRNLYITFIGPIIGPSHQFPQQFQIEYELRAHQNGYIVSDAGGRAYDAIWVLARALNHTMAMVKSGNINGTHCENATGSLVPLEQFNYSNEKMGCLLQWNIQQSNFSGVSVRKYNLPIT